MCSNNRRGIGALCAIVFAALLAPIPARAQHADDAKIQADAQKQLNKKQFTGVQVHVQDGVVHLTGQVDNFAAKEEAAKKIAHMHEASGVRNDIAVAAPAGGSVSDEALQQKLAKALTYDRVGYGTTMFNAITVQVRDGVVALGGVVYGPTDKDSALGVVKNTPGVRDVIDHLQVAPTSPMDDRIRQDEARAIYGAPQLNRYALNPAKPIRIVVVNGHVTLAGVVDSKADRDVAGLRANGVPGVFSVQNDLQVAGATER